MLNTHCHIDHVFGNAFVKETYGVDPEYHKADEVTLSYAKKSADLYGIPGYEASPKATSYLKEGERIMLGDQAFDIVFVPGHAPGHVAFIHHGKELILGGDVLFQRSIGRTDLPGGNFDELIDSIHREFYTLADSYMVYSGHGPETTIGEEKKHNPFTTKQK